MQGFIAILKSYHSNAMYNACFMHRSRPEVIKLFPCSSYTTENTPVHANTNLFVLTFVKTNNVVSEQVRHKPACTVTEKS